MPFRFGGDAVHVYLTINSARRVRRHAFPFQAGQPVRQRGGRIHQPARQEGTHPQERLHERGATTLGRQPVRVVVQPPTAPLDPRVPEPRGVHTTRKNPLETVQHTVVVPEFLRTLVFARPRGDDQFADCTFSPSLDMSR